MYYKDIETNKEAKQQKDKSLKENAAERRSKQSAKKQKQKKD